MSANAYPGLFRDPRQGRLWPALVCSVCLHVLLFWSFSRLHIRSGSAQLLASYTLELSGGLGVGPGPAGVKGRSGPTEEAPPPPKIETKAAEKVIPAPEPKSAPRAEEKPAPAPAPKPALPVPKPESGAKPIPLNPPANVKHPPAPPERPTPDAASQPQPPQRPALGQKPGQEAEAEKQVADRIARLQEKRAEQAVSDRIERMRREKGQGGEENVAAKIASLRSRVGSLQERPAGSGREGVGAGAAGPVGPAGGRGGSGNILQDVRLRTYYESLWEAIRRNWSVPPSLEGKGYEAVVAIVWNRQGKLLQVTIEKGSGNRLYDQQAIRALELTSAKGELAIPKDVPEPQDVGFRFRKED